MTSELSYSGSMLKYPNVNQSTKRRHAKQVASFPTNFRSASSGTRAFKDEERGYPKSSQFHQIRINNDKSRTKPRPRLNFPLNYDTISPPPIKLGVERILLDLASKYLWLMLTSCLPLSLSSSELFLYSEIFTSSQRKPVIVKRSFSATVNER